MFNFFNKMVYVLKMTIKKTYSKAFNALKAFNERSLWSLTNIQSDKKLRGTEIFGVLTQHTWFTFINTHTHTHTHIKIKPYTNIVWKQMYALNSFWIMVPISYIKYLSITACTQFSFCVFMLRVCHRHSCHVCGVA